MIVLGVYDFIIMSNIAFLILPIVVKNMNSLLIR